jgi:Cys-rich protein (TIGR01571 family)
MSRGDVRRRYRIRGGGCGDCMAAWCCGPCEITQESLELQEEEDMLRGTRR